MVVSSGSGKATPPSTPSLWQSSSAAQEASAGPLWNASTKKATSSQVSPTPPAQKIRPAQRRLESSLPIPSHTLWVQPPSSADHSQSAGLWGLAPAAPASLHSLSSTSTRSYRTDSSDSPASWNSLALEIKSKIVLFATKMETDNIVEVIFTRRPYLQLREPTPPSTSSPPSPPPLPQTPVQTVENDSEDENNGNFIAKALAAFTTCIPCLSPRKKPAKNGSNDFIPLQPVRLSPESSPFPTEPTLPKYEVLYTHRLSPRKLSPFLSLTHQTRTEYIRLHPHTLRMIPSGPKIYFNPTRQTIYLDMESTFNLYRYINTFTPLPGEQMYTPQNTLNHSLRCFEHIRRLGWFVDPILVLTVNTANANIPPPPPPPAANVANANAPSASARVNTWAMRDFRHPLNGLMTCLTGVKRLGQRGILVAGMNGRVQVGGEVNALAGAAVVHFDEWKRGIGRELT